MADLFAGFTTGIDSPGRRYYAITPHASNNEQISFRSIWVGVGGDVVVVSEDDDVVTFKNAGSGSVIPVRGKRVNAVGTSATNLVGIY